MLVCFIEEALMLKASCVHFKQKSTCTAPEHTRLVRATVVTTAAKLTGLQVPNLPWYDWS